jgi:hypothetical protein
MDVFKLQTSTGHTPPRYYHYGIESAKKEAERLALLHNCTVEILQVHSKVEIKEVPIITRTVAVMKEVKFEVDVNTDDLPF